MPPIWQDIVQLIIKVCVSESVVVEVVVKSPYDKVIQAVPFTTLQGSLT